ncbi:MAG: hypothetical protein R2789_00535 [Microthrixaceae bacterium]
MAPPDPFDLIDLVRSSAHDAGLDGSDPADPLALPGPLARSVVHLLDGWALDPRRIRRHLCISSVVAGRADYFPAGVEPEVLTPPSCLPTHLRWRHHPDLPSGSVSSRWVASMSRNASTSLSGRCSAAVRATGR